MTRIKGNIFEELFFWAVVLVGVIITLVTSLFFTIGESLIGLAKRFFNHIFKRN